MAETKTSEKEAVAAASATDQSSRIKDLETQLEQAKAKAQQADSLADQLAQANVKAEQADALADQLEQVQKQAVAAAAAAAKAETVAFAEVRNDTKVKLKILNGEGAGGRKAVFCCVNGLEFYVPREKEVELPKCVYKSLLDAKDVDPTDGREVPRFNIQVMV
jgi:hypothetical protein